MLWDAARLFWGDLREQFQVAVVRAQVEVDKVRHGLSAAGMRVRVGMGRNAASQGAARLGR